MSSTFRTRAFTAALSTLLGLSASAANAQVFHPNPNAAEDEAAVAARGDVKDLPKPLKDRLVEMAGRPHTYLPMQAYKEADKPSQLFLYYLLSTDHLPRNVFNSFIPGVNDQAMKTTIGGNGGLPTIGAVREVVEPKPGLPTDPNNPRAFIDVFTDISGLFVINNESGWYEGWMIHDLRVADSAPAMKDGHAQFGELTAADLHRVEQIGAGHNTPGRFFTVDGKDARFPSESDQFPQMQGNVVPLFLSMGAYNALQQTDVHSYWEFNYQTNWVFPLYELPFTGGNATDFNAGQLGKRLSTIPGSGPSGIQNSAQAYGDSPFRPRDPDRFDAEVDSQREFRMRFIPSGLANEVYLDVYERLVSFEPGVVGSKRLFDAYAYEVARVDKDGDGVISAAEGDVDEGSDGFKDNSRLFLSPTQFDRFAVTREINDGLLAPRFAPSTQAWILTAFRAHVDPTVPAATGRDGDDR